jgi:hypothetical protein
MSRLPSPWLAVLCAGFISMHATGCFGQFKLTQKIWQFNKGVSGEKFVQWLVFLVFVIVPVYELGALIDALILNSLEFWTGNNPVSGIVGHHEDSRIVRLSPTDTLRLSRDADSGVMRLELERGGQAPVVRYFEPLENGMAVRDDAGALLLQARETLDGAVALTDASGATLTVHASEAVEAARRVYLEGGTEALARHAVAQASVSRGMALGACVAP